MAVDERSPVTKALRLLAHLAVADQPIALADLSRALKLPKPTTYRLAKCIEDAGFVHKDPLTRRYCLGHAFEELALNALRHGGGSAARKLLMNELAEKLGARVNLVVLKSGNLSFVHWVESTVPLRIDFGSDAEMPAHCTASGKLLVAFGPKELQEEVLRSAPFRSFTEKTISTARGLKREFEKIRERGYSEDDQEFLPGVNCLAVPISNDNGEVVAGLAVMAPVASLPLAKLRTHLGDLREYADRVAKEFGWDTAPPVKYAPRRNDNANPGPECSVGRGDL